MKNKFSKLMSILITVTMLLGIVLPAWTVSAAASLGQITNDDEASIVPPADDYSYVNFAAEIDETAEFTDDSVIVFMKRSETEVNKVYTAEDFPELDVAYIEDLTYLTNEELLSDPEFMANYTQILQIHLNTDTEEEVVDAVEALNNRSMVDVASVTPNYVMEMESTTDDPPVDDTYYSSQEGYFSRINLQAAWNLLPDDISTVKVGVIDTGVVQHEDLPILSEGYDAVNNNNITDDITDPHGTKVASVIGAISDNNRGIAGIAHNVEIVPIQGSTLNGLIKVVTYLNNNYIAITNWSVVVGFIRNENTSDEDYNNALQTYLNNFKTVINNYYGLLVVSAGNNSNDIIDDNLPVPSILDCTNIISVMGTKCVKNANGNDIDIRYISSETSGSNYSSTYVDIAAPYEAYTANYDTVTQVHSYGKSLGTSVSAPYVTGVAALIKGIRPELGTNDIKDIILGTARTTNTDLDGECVTEGMLDAGAAVEMALAYTIAEPQKFMNDVDGDGCDDLVYYREYNGQRHFQTFLGNGYNHCLGNIASDGTTYTSLNTFAGNGNYNTEDIAYMGDINGDGRSDMIIHSKNSSGKRVLTVYKGKTNGKFESAFVTTTTNTHNTTTYPCAMFVGDFNGDTRDDFLVQYKDLNGTRTNLLYCGLEEPNEDSPNGLFDSPIKTTSNRTYIDPSNDPIFISDTDGNGCDDIVIHWSANNKRQLLVYPGSGDGKFNSPDGVNAKNVNTNTNDNSDTSVYPCTLHMGDFNGDGKGDFLVHYKTLSNKRANFVFCGNSSYKFDSGVGTSFTQTYSANDKVYVADVTGDEIDDVIVQWVSSGKRQLMTYSAVLDDVVTFADGVNVNTNEAHDITSMSIEMMVGDIDGDFNMDFVVEYASADTAYRSVVCINRGYSVGLRPQTIKCNLRTYYYIAFN